MKDSFIKFLPVMIDNELCRKPDPSIILLALYPVVLRGTAGAYLLVFQFLIVFVIMKLLLLLQGIHPGHITLIHTQG